MGFEVTEAAMENVQPKAELRFGAKLKHARLTRQLRLKDVAARTGCSEGMLSKIENDKVAPSIGLLHRIVSALGTNVSKLFEATSESFITRASARPILNNFRGDGPSEVSFELLTPVPSPALFQSAIHTVPPHSGSDGLVEHEGEDFGYILEGTLKLFVGDQTFLLGEGDTFYFPSTIAHAYVNLGDTQTRVLWFNTPPTF